ncbi:tyrosine-type recombinase/integrase [Nonomuraea basaltis]|uniref:tyrosine-type recombinase/integrase n=1 Tax=Nonomuraea basaltis TaxID=2495887 RepID=UPI001F0FE49E|nr:tyrosine-type recombinase/integrase [Nonomuraea basaltis]
MAGPQYPVAARLDKLFTDPAHALRERVLWRLLYDTAARTEEILSLNVEDLDLEFRRARVVSKDGAIEYVHWATATARLRRCRSSTPARPPRPSPCSGSGTSSPRPAC